MSPDDLLFCFAVLALPITLYGIAPILVRSRQRIMQDPEVTELAIEEMPSHLRAGQRFITQMREMLEDLGFEYRGFVHVAGVGGQDMYSAKLVHRASSTSAEVLFTLAGTRPGATSGYVVLETKLSDGTIVGTHNSVVAGVFPPPLHRKVFATESTDPHTLHRQHEILVARHRALGTPVLDDSKSIVEIVRDELREGTAQMVASGYWEPTERGDVLRLTWKGAYFASWKMSWPVKPIRAWNRRRRLHRTLAPGAEHEGPASRS